MFKLIDGTRMYMHKCIDRDDEFAPDVTGRALDIRDDQKRLVSNIAYMRGLEDHPLRDHVRVVHQLEASLAATNTMAAPDQESTSEEEDRDNAVAESDDSHDSEGSAVPQYQVIQEDPEPNLAGTRTQGTTCWTRTVTTWS